jgi:putative peptide zinc metalloprotease protein
MASLPQRLVSNPLLQDLPFHGQAGPAMRLLEVPRSDGGTARIAVTPAVAALIAAFDGRETADVLRTFGGTRDPEAVRRLERVVAEQLMPRRLVVSASASQDSWIAEARPTTYFRIRVPLLSEGVVRPVARVLGRLFLPQVVAVMLVVIALCHGYFYAFGWRAGGGAHEVPAQSWLAVVLLTTAGALIHEFGHAAASARCGCERVRIGWGIYVYMAVLYTDLSEAWRLPQRQRAVIDAGGLYLQAIFVAMLCVLALTTGSGVWQYAAVASNLSMATALNPFLRMDGYWLAADLLGVPSFRHYGLRLVDWLVGPRRPRGSSTPIGERLGDALGLRPRTALALVAYMIATTVFFTYIVSLLVRHVLWDLLRHYKGALAAVLATAATGTAGATAGAVGRVLWFSLIIVGCTLFLWRVVRTCADIATVVRRRHFDRRCATGANGVTT